MAHRLYQHAKATGQFSNAGIFSGASSPPIRMYFEREGWLIANPVFMEMRKAYYDPVSHISFVMVAGSGLSMFYQSDEYPADDSVYNPVSLQTFHLNYQPRMVIPIVYMGGTCITFEEPGHVLSIETEAGIPGLLKAEITLIGTLVMVEEIELINGP